MNKSLKFKSFFGVTAFLVLFLYISFNLFSQEIPNGDNDLIWKAPVKFRTGSASTLHPINSNIFLTGDRNNFIYEYDIKTGNLLRTIEANPNIYEILTLKFDYEGKLLFVELSEKSEQKLDSNIQIIDNQTGQTVKYLKMKGRNICTYPNNNLLLLTDYNYNKVYKYDYLNEKKLDSTEKYYAVFKITNSPDGSLFAIAYKYIDYYYVDIYDANTFKKIKQLPYEWSEPIRVLNFSNYNNYLLVISLENEITSDIIKLNGDLKFNYGKSTEGVGFSNDENSWCVVGSAFNRIINFYEKEKIFSKYFINNYGLIRILNENKLLMIRKDSLFLYSNRWLTVGINPPTEIHTKVYYESDELIFKFEDHEILKSFYITDSLGRKVQEQNNLNYQNNGTLRYKIILVPGLYFVTITTDKGQEPVLQFIVNK